MEIFLEFFFEVYLELMMYIVPEEKATSKLYRFFAIVLATIVLLGVSALFVWGIVLLEDKNLKGFILIGISIVLSLLQIILGFIFHKNANDKTEN